MGQALVGRRILIIDADQISRTVLRFAYSMRGHQVRVVSSAPDALAQVEADPPEVVIFDWDFRDDSGRGLAKKLRAAARRPLAIISLSVLNEPEGFCQREGIDGYIVKPALPATVERAFEAALATFDRARRL